MRARRVAVKREEGRRRLRRLLALLALAVATAVAAAVLFSPLFDVDSIAVAGVGAERAQAVRDAAGVTRGDPTLLVDTGKVEARIEALPWVAHASVSRQLPGTLRIAVTARVAVGWAPDPYGRAAVIDRRGVVIDTLAAPSAGLPRLGPGKPATSSHRLASPLAARVAAALPGDVRRTTAVVTVERGQATVVLAQGPQLRLGDGQALAEKVRAALAVLGARSGVPTAYIDVAVPTAPATG